MPLSKIQAESMNLADTYAFTGTVSGAGSLVKLYSSASSDSVSQLILDSTYINSTYDNYKIIIGYTVDTDGTRMDAQFYVGGTKVTGTDYSYELGALTSSTYTYDADGATQMQLSHTMGNASGETQTLILDLTNVNSTTIATRLHGFHYGGATNVNTVGRAVQAGQDAGAFASVVNGIEFFPHQGTAKFLHFTLYGYTK